MKFCGICRGEVEQRRAGDSVLDVCKMCGAMEATICATAMITHEEKALLKAIAMYPSSAAIARVRGENTATIQRKINTLRQKLGADDKAELVAMAREMA